MEKFLSRALKNDLLIKSEKKHSFYREMTTFNIILGKFPSHSKTSTFVSNKIITLYHFFQTAFSERGFSIHQSQANTKNVTNNP